MTLPESATRYEAVSDAFTQLVAGTTDWNSPAPVAGWTARDVVWHLVDWIPNVLFEGAAIELPRRNPEAADPCADWAHFNDGMRAVLAQPGFAEGTFAHPMAGSMPLGTAIDMLVTPDIFMHSWDLARASQQSIALDADYSAALLAGMEGVEEMLRSSGHYGQRVVVPDDADSATRLIAFIGRDPHWQPADASPAP
jgi:uncharacterized protein (TIGR03086 family)